MKKLFSSILVASLFIGALMFTGCKNDAGPTEPTDFEARGTYYYLVDDTDPTDPKISAYYEVDYKVYLVAALTDEGNALAVIYDEDPLPYEDYNVFKAYLQNQGFSSTKAFSKTTGLEGITSNFAIKMNNIDFAIFLESIVNPAVPE